MFESFNKFTGTINEAKAQYMIGDKEASREDVLSYIYDGTDYLWTYGLNYN